jgi:hypothetical protein
VLVVTAAASLLASRQAGDRGSRDG